MLNLNPDTNLGTCKLSVCTPGVRTHWYSPLWDPETSNCCWPSANEVGGCQRLVSSGGWNPYYTGGHSSHCVAKNKIQKKKNQLAKRLTIFLNLWYLGHVDTPIFLAFRMGKKKDRKAPNFNGCSMCLTNIVFIKYYLVCKVCIFSNKMYILFSRNDII
jgi:hypothetical protein